MQHLQLNVKQLLPKEQWPGSQQQVGGMSSNPAQQQNGNMRELSQLLISSLCQRNHSKLTSVQSSRNSSLPAVCCFILVFIRCLSDPRFQYKESELKGNNPLLIPIMLGWERQVSKHKQGGRRKVFYLAPCGRRLRTLEEVHRYLRTTSSLLEIDFFNFDWWLHVFNEFKPAREFCTIKDLSYGKENVPVSCVNSIDRSYPEYLEYSTVRLPQKNVSINTDNEFLSCCDCTDDCVDKDKYEILTTETDL